MVNEEGQEMTIRGESLGGGKARLCRINGVEVDFTGEYSSIVVVQKDAPGVVGLTLPNASVSLESISHSCVCSANPKEIPLIPS